MSSTICVEEECSNSSSKCLNILYFNARSILPKLDELKIVAEENTPCPDLEILTLFCV